MALSENQLLMLNILMFTDYIKNGVTVQEIACRIESDLNSNKNINACRMNASEWRSLANMVKRQSDLLPYCVQHYKDDPDSTQEAACFVDDPVNPQDIIIVFKGTCQDDEWFDNAMGCYQSDTQKQIEAVEYVNRLPVHYGNNMTATGHSKGGNKAQYITIVTNRIGRCVSFDSQGFSKSFLQKYADEISQKSNRIIVISAADDYVNSTLFPIPGKRLYLESDIKNVTHYIEFHKPNVLLNEYGELNQLKEQSKFPRQISEYCAYVISNYKGFKKGDDISDLTAFLDKVRDVHTKLGRQFLQPVWDFFCVFVFLFVIIPVRMPSAIFKGSRLVLSYINANTEYLKARHQESAS